MLIDAHPRVLVLAPHTDDAELGAGGTISRVLECGGSVHVAVFSVPQESLPDGTAPDTLLTEFQAAMKIVGVPPEAVTVRHYPVRRLLQHRQEILQDLIRLRTEFRPTLVLAPSASDQHQDHQALAAEAPRAFRHCSLIGYELPWNHLQFTSAAFIAVSEAQLEKKWEALRCYRSQLEIKRPYFDREFVRGLARVRGVQCGSDYAEAFDVVRLVSGLPGSILPECAA